MTPEDRVTQFCAAMLEWESWYFPLLSTAHLRGDMPEVMAEAQKRLRPIFAAHLTEKARGPQRFGKLLDRPHAGSPSRYDQTTGPVEPAGKKNLSYVRSQPRHDPNTSYRFTIAADLIDDLRSAVMRDGQIIGEWRKPLY
jgi:hypothetical protein